MRFILVSRVFKIPMYTVNIILRLFKNCNSKDEAGKNLEYNKNTNVGCSFEVMTLLYGE